jgi:outer membrane lipoprotein-sorting protein
MRTAIRWTIPATVATAVIGGSLAGPSLAGAAPDLAPTTVADLMAEVAGSSAQAFSGTVVQTTDLGLPQLPSGAVGQDQAGLSDLISGTTTARIWSDGGQRSRIAVLGRLAETDVVRDGTDVWTWRSGTGTVAHAVVPAGPAGAAGPAQARLTPAQAAQQALAAVEPSTRVTLGSTATVAGRQARTLVLEPHDAGSLVGRVVIAVDAATATPLQVQVFPSGGAEPAVQTGFTAVSFDAPSPSEVAPALPGGSAVEEVTPQTVQAQAGTVPQSTVVGSGWTSVAVLRTAGAQPGSAATAAAGEADATELLQAMSRPISGAYGNGRLITSSVLTALVLDDGRVLVGAVPAAQLERAALDPAAQP